MCNVMSPLEVLVSVNLCYKNVLGHNRSNWKMKHSTVTYKHILCHKLTNLRPCNVHHSGEYTDCKDALTQGQTTSGVYIHHQTGPPVCISSILWHGHWWWWVDSVPVQRDWISQLLSQLDWLSARVWKFRWRVLARSGEDTLSNTYCYSTTNWHAGLWRKFTICTVLKFHCW